MTCWPINMEPSVFPENWIPRHMTCTFRGTSLCRSFVKTTDRNMESSAPNLTRKFVRQHFSVTLSPSSDCNTVAYWDIPFAIIGIEMLQQSSMYLSGYSTKVRSEWMYIIITFKGCILFCISHYFLIFSSCHNTTIIKVQRDLVL
jgi:hypothetical protein